MNYYSISLPIRESIAKIEIKLENLFLWKELLEIGVKSINRRTCDMLENINNEISFLKLERENLIFEANRIEDRQLMYKQHRVIKDHIVIDDIHKLDKNFQKKTIDEMVRRIGRPINDYNRS